MRRRRPGVVLAAVAALIGAVVLTSCKASEPAYYRYNTSEGTRRCTMGQSAIGETSDHTAAGLIPSQSTTKTMRSSGCDVVDALHPGWNSLGSYTALYKRRADGTYFACATSQFVRIERADNEVSTSATQRCGAGNYQTLGQHLYNPFSGPDAGYLSDFFTLTPLAYNA